MYSQLKQSAACQLTEIPSGKREQVICERGGRDMEGSKLEKNTFKTKHFCFLSYFPILAQKWLSRPQSCLECLGRNISGNHTYSYK